MKGDIIMQFNTIKLAGSRVLVTGDSDAQQCILDSTEWDQVKLHLAEIEAAVTFDEQVGEFFAPLAAATEAAEAVIQAATPKEDNAFTILVHEGVEGEEHECEEVIILSRGAAILRMIEHGETKRLIWVGSTIEITAV